MRLKTLTVFFSEEEAGGANRLWTDLLSLTATSTKKFFSNQVRVFSGASFFDGKGSQGQEESTGAATIPGLGFRISEPPDRKTVRPRRVPISVDRKSFPGGVVFYQSFEKFRDFEVTAFLQVSLTCLSRLAIVLLRLGVSCCRCCR